MKHIKKMATSILLMAILFTSCANQEADMRGAVKENVYTNKGLGVVLEEPPGWTLDNTIAGYEMTLMQNVESANYTVIGFSLAKMEEPFVETFANMQAVHNEQITEGVLTAVEVGEEVTVGDRTFQTLYAHGVNGEYFINYIYEENGYFVRWAAVVPSGIEGAPLQDIEAEIKEIIKRAYT